ncbi:hypothetical protein WN943_005857 [Citrus x changshan-huyou]
MENYLNMNFDSVQPKNPSEEALRRWRSAVGIVKNRRRRFRMVADLVKRSEAEKAKLKIQEKIRVAILVQIAALHYTGKSDLEEESLSEHLLTEAAEAGRNQESVDDVGSTDNRKSIYNLLSKCKKRIIAVLPLVCNLFTYLVLEATSFVVYLLGCFVSKVISSLRDTLSYLLLGPTSFVRHKLKYYVLESISSLWELFSNLVLEAISDIQDLVKKSKWSFLLGFGIAVCACILARTTAATREEFERQLTGAVGILFSVIQWIITSVYFTLADLGVKSNYSASVLLLLFSIATLFLFKKDEDATDSSHAAYNISTRNLRISHVPAFDYVPRTANRFFLLIIWNLMNQFNLVNDLPLISSTASLMAPAAPQVNQQYQWQNIKKVCQLLGKHKKCSLAVFYLVLEAASFLLDLYGKSERGFLLAAFLLSAFSFAMCMYTCIMGRSRGATSVQSQKQLVRTVEVAFSVVQLVVTLVYLILAEIHVKNNFSASVFPLVFAIIVAVFTLKNDGGASDSSGHTDDDLYGDLSVTSIPLIQAIPSTSNERFLIGMMVESWNPERVLNMINNLAPTMALAADHQHNLQYQLQNIQVHSPNNIVARGAIDSTMFTRDEDAETNPSPSMLTILISYD